MATHSSVLAWRIPGMGEPGGLPSMGSHRVGQLSGSSSSSTFSHRAAREKDGGPESSRAVPTRGPC